MKTVLVAFSSIVFLFDACAKTRAWQGIGRGVK
jgi:hypothetical protein